MPCETECTTAMRTTCPAVRVSCSAQAPTSRSETVTFTGRVAITSTAPMPTCASSVPPWGAGDGSNEPDGVGAGASSNDAVSKELVSKELVSKELVSNEVVSNEVVSKEVVSKEVVSKDDGVIAQ